MTPPLTPPFTLTVLTAAHRVAVCVSGDAHIDEYLDEYLHTMALREQEQGLATVHVAVDATADVVGYFTLSPMSLRGDSSVADALARTGFPYLQISGYLLGRLGVTRRHQGAGVGSALVARAADLARAQRHTAGGVYLAVDPKTLALVDWYARLGFRLLDPSRKRLRMLLPLI